MLENFIEPLWVSDEETFQKILKHPIKREDKKICLTKCPEYARMLADNKVPCVFVETEEKESTVFGVDLIFAARDEVIEPDSELLKRVWQRHFSIPWQIAQTERLIIRESVMTDLPEFMQMYESERENPDVVPMTGNPEEELAAYIKYRYPFYEYGLWSIIEKSTGKVIGRAGLQEYTEKNDSLEETCIEVAYLIAEQYRKKGYAREAVQAILEYGEQELGQKAVYLRTSNENRASRNLAKTLGFKRISEKLYWRIKK